MAASTLRACEVSFAYPQAGNGFGPISLDVCAGETLLVSGPSGCGKSTLARCLTGLIPHLYEGTYTGEVIVNGLRTVDAPLWQLAEQAGLVFQNPAAQMLAPTVEDEILFGLENLGLPRLEMSRRLEAALERFGLGSMRLRAPLTLSGGEQQKLALAAITTRRPAALVLDEPLSMLDTTAALDFVAHTQELGRDGAAVVYCEHRQEFLRGLPGLQQFVLPGPPACDGAAPLPPAPLPERRPFDLHAHDIRAGYGQRAVIHDLNLDLSGGQTVALVGRNGVGKTTLLRCLAGLHPYAGIVEVRREGISEPAQLGIVFQNPDLQLFNASVRDEIMYRLAQPDMGLYTWVLNALGLDKYETTPPLILSEGEKRRVALALMIMRLPRHGLLLDEPALGQDQSHKENLLRFLRAYAAAGYLAIYSTHDLDLAAHADYLILLGPEGIAAQGPAAEVLHMRDIWQRLGFVLPEWVQHRWCGGGSAPEPVR